MITLTATATKITCNIIFDALLMQSPHIVFESPDKGNVTYSVHYMPNDTELEYHFSWLVNELKAEQNFVAAP